MVLDSIVEKKFWIDWQDRFEDDYGRYINPTSRSVANYARGLDIDTSGTDYQVSERLWRHIDRSYTYKLSKEWKEPKKTIRQGIGDCEDFVFLLGSLLPHFGVNNFEVVIGEVNAGNEPQLHTWMRVEGRTVDPTTGPNEMDGLSYKEVESYNVNVDL